MKSRIIIIVFFLCLSLCLTNILFAEDVTITTYYPAPYGKYTQLDVEQSAGSGGTLTVQADTHLATVSGDVGIGTATPSAKLDVLGQIIGGFGASNTSGVQDWNDLSNTRSGNGYTLLLGTHPNGPSAAGGNYFHPFNFEYYSKDGSGNTTQLAIPYGNTNSINQGIYVRGRYSGSWTNWVKIIAENTAGNVGIGTTTPGYKLDVNGDINSSGQISAGTTETVSGHTGHLFDLAEDIMAKGCEAGDVVVISPDEDASVIPSSKAYDPAVAGIISIEPAFHIGKLENGLPLALAGRVMCKVSLENGAIKRGDLLVTSSTAGHAMRGEPSAIGYGMVLGKALQPFTGGGGGEETGEILVLVTLH